MMKKLLAFSMAVAIMVCIVGCSSPETPVTTKPQQDTTTAAPSVTEPATTAATESQKVEKDLPILYKVPGRNIYVDAPNFQEIEQAYTELFIVHGEKYIAFTAARRSEATDAKEAHTEPFIEFTYNFANYEGGVNGITITSEEIKTINGIEVYRFEGTINYGTDNLHDGYAVGYSFIMDETPCEILGSVIDESQDPALIEEIEGIVDAMIQTVRSEP